MNDFEFAMPLQSLKYTKDKKQLQELADKAVEQIIEQKYDPLLQGKVVHIGLVHCGKEVEMC